MNTLSMVSYTVLLVMAVSIQLQKVHNPSLFVHELPCRHLWNRIFPVIEDKYGAGKGFTSGPIARDLTRRRPTAIVYGLN